MVTGPMFDGELLPAGDMLQTSDVDTSGVLLRSRNEIVQLLRQLQTQFVPLTLAMADASASMRGPLVFIDEASNVLLVECPNGALGGQSGAVLITCVFDDSKFEFQSASLNFADVDGMPVAGIELPEYMWRFQRRRAQRLDARTLRITLNMGFIDADARVTNMSLGGAGVVCVGADVHLAVGEVLHGCTIALPGVGEVRADLKVRHVLPARDGKGAAILLAGCEFKGLSGHARNLMTRYLDAVGTT